MGRALARLGGIVAAGIAVVVLVTAPRSDETPEGRDSGALTAQGSGQAVEAYFAREGYAPGDTGRLVVDGSSRGITVQLFRAGSAPSRGRQRDRMTGAPVTARAPYTETIRMGAWPSGVYFAELQSADGRVGYAPFVLSPKRLGEHRVAVVLPTSTWQAYNGRDADGDGLGDTWYEDAEVRTIDLTRPFLDRGVPPHFGHYDLPFLRWLRVTGKEVDYFSQLDLEQVPSGDALARAYDLIVFPGHHEYVTAREYDVVERYRDLGGNLMFLSANNFYYQVVRRGDTLTRIGGWRDAGRPEAALVGVQYIDNDEGEQRAPYTLRQSPATRWAFAGTGLGAGEPFASFGIEIDHTAPSSPPGIQVLGEIPNLFGTGMTAQMTYYATPRGAEVFAAGAFTLGGAALWPQASRVLQNLWARLADEPPAPTFAARAL
jgi:hypothetical protein